MPDRHVLVTGAAGFLAARLIERLDQSKKYLITGVLREVSPCLPPGVRVVRVGDIGPQTEWSSIVAGVDVVIHTAARVHVMKERAHDPLGEYRQVNVYGTTRLARQAAVAGVRRFIFISSIGVNGRETPLGKPFRVDDLPAPCDAYSTSKLEAENVLRDLARNAAMDVVILRPPLIYGHGAKGNFRRLVHWVSREIPLPLANVENKRSLVAIDNLVDLIETCIDHPNARNRVFLAADAEDISTPDLLRQVARALGKRERLFTVPLPLLRIAADTIGKPELYSQLCCSLQVDISRTCESLHWMPPVRVTDGLRTAVVSCP